MWIGLSLYLISAAQQQLSACHKFFSYRILNVRVEAQPESCVNDVHKAKKKKKKDEKHNEMHGAAWGVKPRQAVPRGLITNAASFSPS